MVPFQGHTMCAAKLILIAEVCSVRADFQLRGSGFFVAPSGLSPARDGFFVRFRSSDGGEASRLGAWAAMLHAISSCSLFADAGRVAPIRAGGGARAKKTVNTDFTGIIHLDNQHLYIC